MSAGVKRIFETGASRDSSEGKIDFEGHISPFALERYAEYMHRHRSMPDGSLRASDNWQLGIPEEECLKSALRHILEVWKAHRSKTYEWLPKKPMDPQNYEESICAVIFNLFTILHQRVTCGGCESERQACVLPGCKCKEWSVKQ